MWIKTNRAWVLIAPLIVLNFLGATNNLIPLNSRDMFGPHPYLGALFVLNLVLFLVLSLASETRH